MKAKVKRKLEEQRTEVSEAERLAAFDMVPLPPDMYEKPILWSREVMEHRCRATGCPNMTAEVLCSEHFQRVLLRVQAGVIEQYPRAGVGNGN